MRCIFLCGVGQTHGGWPTVFFREQRVTLKPAQTCPLIQSAVLLRHVSTVGITQQRDPSASTSPCTLLLCPPRHHRASLPLPCPGSPRCCLPCCSFSCRAWAGDTSPRSAGAQSLRSSLPGSSSRWSAATRRTLCRCFSVPSSVSTTRRTALHCGECHQC